MAKYALEPVKNYSPYADSLTPETFRIRALRDIPEHGVKAGDEGGRVDSERNLSQSGSAWIAAGSSARGQASVSGNALVKDGGFATGNSKIDGNAVITNYAQIAGNAVVTGNAKVALATITDNAILRENAYVSQPITIGGDADIGGDVRLEQYGTPRITISKGTYREQSDAPYFLQAAKMEDEQYLGYVKEAALIDPKLQRLLAVALETKNGPFNEDYDKAAEYLYRHNTDTRQALHTLVSIAGGTFTKNEYTPREENDAISMAIILGNMNLRKQFENYRCVRNLANVSHHFKDDDKDTPLLPEGIHPVIVEIVFGETEDGEDEVYYQPAFTQTINTNEDVLMRARGQINILPEVYANRDEAHSRLVHLVAGMTEREIKPYFDVSDPSENNLIKHLNFDVNKLPLVTQVTDHGQVEQTIMAARLTQSWSTDFAYLGADAENDYAAVTTKSYGPKIDLSAVFNDPSVEYSQYPAVALQKRAFIQPGMKAQDLESGLKTEIFAREQALKQFQDHLSEATSPAQKARLQASIRQLDPLNKPILASVDRVRLPEIDPAPKGISFESIKAALPELAWEMKAMRNGDGGYSKTLQFAMPTHSTERYVIEETPIGCFNLHVDVPVDPRSPWDEKGLASNPIFTMEDLDHIDDALTLADNYRATKMALQVGAPIPAQVVQQLGIEIPEAQIIPDPNAPRTEILAAVYKIRHAEDDDYSYQTGSIVMDETGLVKRFIDTGRYADSYDFAEIAAYDNALEKMTEKLPAVTERQAPLPPEASIPSGYKQNYSMS